MCRHILAQTAVLVENDMLLLLFHLKPGRVDSSLIARQHVIFNGEAALALHAAARTVQGLQVFGVGKFKNYSA